MTGPGGPADSAAETQAEAETEIVPVRDAATVLLLRDGAEGIETWLLTRVGQMTFAAGMSVFPGGRVEARDAELPFDGALTGLAERLGCPERQARELLGGAVRETFEETGVLLTEPSTDALLAHRAEVEAGRLDFGALLRGRGLQVPVDALQPWARWITPLGEVRRYDTRFFVGALPPGAQAADVTTESSVAAWVPVAQALAQAERGERRLMPPTRTTLSAVAAHSTVAEVLAAAPAADLTAILPVVRRGADGGGVVEVPDGTTFTVPASMLSRRP